jgi:hypothetical protein
MEQELWRTVAPPVLLFDINDGSDPRRNYRHIINPATEGLLDRLRVVGMLVSAPARIAHSAPVDGPESATVEQD